jgi:PAS domain S-box-containing protein
LAHANFILVFCLAINLGLALYLYFNNRNNIFNRPAAFLLSAIVFWILLLIAFANAATLADAIFWRKLTPIGASLVVSFLLYFCLLFPLRPKNSNWLTLPVLFLPGILFAGLAVFSNELVRGIVVTAPGELFLARPIFGWAYNFFYAYVLIYCLAALGLLIGKLFVADEEQRQQIGFVLSGALVSVFLVLIFGLVMPALGWVALFIFSPAFTLLGTVLLVLAVLKSQPMARENFVARGVPLVGGTMAVIGSIAAIWLGRSDFLLTFYAVLANVILGLMVLLDNPRHEVNRSFALISWSIAFWSFCIYQINVSEQILLWGRLAFLGPAIIPTAFLYFSWLFPRRRWRINRLVFWLFMFPGILMSLLVFSPWLVERAIYAPSGLILTRGPLYQPFMFYIVLYLALGAWELIRKYRLMVGAQRSQLGYVFLGFASSLVPFCLTNLILPLFGIVELGFFGPFFTLFLVGFVSYAMIKQRLASVEIFLQRGAVYAVATVLIMAVYALAVMISEIYLRRIIGYSSLFITAFAALMIAVVYQPLIGGFQNLTDRLFFRGRYDYQKTIREISHKIASVIQLDELTGLIVSSFINTMKVAEISFLLPDKEREHFRSLPLSLPRYKNIEIDSASPIVSWLEKTQDILIREEIEEALSRQESSGAAGDPRWQSLREVRDEMDRLGISVWVPIIAKDILIGVIALGNKLSGDVFTAEDIGLLSTLASQTAVALDNARLYDEVVNMKEYNEKILQSMVSGVLTVDTRSKIVTFNHMAETITGYNSAAVMGKSCEEIWGKRGVINNIVDNTLVRGKQYVNFESRLASPARGLVPVAFSSTILLDHTGKRLGALLTIQDLSEVKELEDKVRQADKLAALATMAAGMAHEIKNPLSSMKVLSQLLPKKIDDPEYRQKLEEIMPREIDRIDKIVESLLGFARATTLTFEKADITEILEDNLKYFEPQAKAAEVKIERDFIAVPPIEVDKAQIVQVFSNLILNAIQAMKEGGGTLTVKVFPGKMVDNVLYEVKIQIADTGHGIAEETLKKLFDPFFTTKYGGTGLGLTISHSIVDGHKGYIDVESHLGRGTTFTVTLPVAQGLV